MLKGEIGGSWFLCSGLGRWPLWARCCGALSVSSVSLTHGQQCFSQRNGLPHTVPLLVQGVSLISHRAAERPINIHHVPCCVREVYNEMRKYEEQHKQNQTKQKKILNMLHFLLFRVWLEEKILSGKQLRYSADGAVQTHKHIPPISRLNFH